MADGSRERWRVVPGHPDYMASDQGRIRSHKRGGIRVLKAGPDYSGYRRTILDGQAYYAHQIVALTWIGPRPDGMEVHHKNHDRGDNRAENLSYTTRQANLAERRTVQPKALCKYGHPLFGDNVYIIPSSGVRLCRICRRRRMKQPTKKDCPTCGRPYDQGGAGSQLTGSPA